MEGLLSFPVMQKLNVNGKCFCLIWFWNSTAAIYINESTREQNRCIFHENLEQETFIAEFFLRFRFPAPVCCSPVSLPANVPYLSVLVFLDGCRWSPPMSASANSFPCIKQQRLALCLPFFQDSFMWAVKETFPLLVVFGCRVRQLQAFMHKTHENCGAYEIWMGKWANSSNFFPTHFDQDPQFFTTIFWKPPFLYDVNKTGATWRWFLIWVWIFRFCVDYS